MSISISRGYAEVQILKTSESDPLSFWNILICICPNSEKSKTEKDIKKFRHSLYEMICPKNWRQFKNHPGVKDITLK